MENDKLFQFVNRCAYGVISYLGDDNSPRSAVVGIAVTSDLEIVFDTVESSRKVPAIDRDGRVSLACWEGVTTVQYEGLARRISSTVLGEYHRAYFAKFTDGPARLKWPGITYYAVAPKWIRYTGYNQSPPETIELRF